MTYSARYRRDIRSFLAYFVKAAVAHKAETALFCAVRDAVNANVNDDRTVFYHVCRYCARATRGGDKNICLARNFSHILCSCVADCNRAVCFLTRQKKRDRLSNDIAASDDYGVLAARLNAHPLQKHDNSVRISARFIAS